MTTPATGAIGTTPDLHGPGDIWMQGPGQGCKPGYVEQQLADGQHWTCIPQEEFDKIFTGHIFVPAPTVESVLAAASPAIVAIAATAPIFVPPVSVSATPQEHASRWHLVLSLLAGLLKVATSPEVTKLLDPRAQGIIAVFQAVEQVVAAPAPSADDAPAVVQPRQDAPAV